MYLGRFTSGSGDAVLEFDDYTQARKVPPEWQDQRRVWLEKGKLFCWRGLRYQPWIKWKWGARQDGGIEMRERNRDERKKSR